MGSKYYKSYAEGTQGEEGHFYCEVIDEKIVRQTFALEGELYWATPGDENNEHYFFTDQPEFPSSDIPRQQKEFDLIQLTEQGFLQVWNAALEKVY